MRNGIAFAAVVLGVGLLAGCPEAPDGAERTDAAIEEVAAEVGRVVVYKSPTCGCCDGWIAHLDSAGFDVEGVDVAVFAELNRTKAEHGVPGRLASCHTARVGGYTIEGHVPAEVVARLLREGTEDIVGISVPGMPIGSPGMEGPNPQVYQVMAFDAEGNPRVYETVDPR